MDDAVQVMDTSNLVQEKLKELYKKQLTIPRAAWMESGMDLPLQEFYVELKLQLLGQPVTQNQIFDDVTAKRILIEGLPGYGKTTLVTKIAYDWAVNEEYTQRFQLVFLLAVRGLEEVSVVDGIVDLVADSEYDDDPEEIREMIEREEFKILLILDGLDEATQRTRDKILRILYKKEMKRMTVVVTCRTEEFNLKPEEDRTLFKGISRKTTFSDRRIMVLGIANERKEFFLDKFLKCEKTTIDKVKKYLANITKRMEEVFHSPLMLTLLADMMLRDKVIGSISSVTSFLKIAINFMIRRSQERNNLFLKPTFDVFEARNSENGSYKFKLRQFSQLCFQHNWRSSNLEFDDSDLTRSVHNMGLLIKGKRLTLASCTNHFQIYHRIFLEFLAAYHMWDEFVRNDFIFPSNCEEKLVEDIVHFASTSMVRPFLIELMKEKAEIYFQLMIKHNILQRKLKELYKRLPMPPITYTHERPDLPIQFFLEMILENSLEKIKVHHIFNDNTTNRILFESLPGYGKTTLVTKIAHDWADNKPYTQLFDLLFLLPIKEFQDQSVIEAVVTLVSISGYYKPLQVLEEVKSQNKRILLILDGVEDASPILAEDVLKILYKLEMSEMTVIVTCQTDEIDILCDVAQKVGVHFSGCDSYFERFTIMGVNKDYKKKFLKNLVTEAGLQETQTLHNVTEQNETFFNSPLVLNILSHLIVKRKILVPTMTAICKEVINILLKRSEEKRNQFLSNSFTIFDDDNDENLQFKIKLQEIGRLCFLYIWIKDFNFPRVVLCNRNYIERTAFGLHTFQQPWYLNYHRVITEFMAAYYIFHHFLDSNSTFSKDIEHKLLINIIYNGATTNMTPFLIGLMKENSSGYFTLMSAYDYLFKKHQIPLWRMLKECDCVEAITEQLAPIIPTQFSRLSSTDLSGSYSRNLYNQLVKIKSQSGLMSPFYVNVATKLSLPKGIELPEVHFYPSIQCCRLISKMVMGITCKSCHLHCNPNDDQLYFTEYYQIFTNISSEEYVFNCYNKSSIHLLNKINEWPQKMKINQIVYDYVNYSSSEQEKHAVLEAICSLLNKCRVKHLIFESNCEQEIIQLLSHCEKVNFLKFTRVTTDRKLCVELNLLANQESKTCSNTSPSLSELISQITFSSHLECDADTWLQQNIFPWFSIETVTDLVLSLQNKIHASLLWKSLERLINLESLTLTDFKVEDTNIKEDVIPIIFQLKINKLQIHFQSNTQFNIFYENLITYVQTATTIGAKSLTLDVGSFIKDIDEISIVKWRDIIEHCYKQKMNLQTVEILLKEKTKQVFKYIETSDRDTAIKYSFNTCLPRVTHSATLRKINEPRIKMIIFTKNK